MKIASTNPSRNYEVLGEVESSTSQEIETAVEKARSVQPEWAALSLDERCQKITSLVKLLESRAEEVAETMTKEMGKPIKAARSQVKDAIDWFYSYIKSASDVLEPEVVFENETEKHVLYREPLGVVVAIGPWNFPILNIPWQMGQALIAGNAVVYKPSEEIILFGKLIEKLIKEAELPDGVFTVMHGDGEVGEQLVRQKVDAVLFTGSTKVGQQITEVKAKSSIKVVTELGGSAPGIVFEDADVAKIIGTITTMRFDNTGQYCDGLKRLIVHETKLDEVLTALKQSVGKLKVGDPLSETTDIGPLVARRQLELLESQVQDALDKGANVEVGGKRPDNSDGAYYLPTVLTSINFDMRVWQEEVFGPVLPVVTFKTEAEAIKLANDTKYGLAGYIFTEGKARYVRVAKQLETGNIAHNNALFYSPHTPFGGYKASGNSRTNGVTGFHEVTQVKIIVEEK